MKKFDLGFVDLDDTIYNTKKLKEDIYGIFEPFGIKRKDFFHAYERAANMPQPGYFHYTFEKQIEAVRSAGISVPDNILPQLKALLDVNYILPEAESFLKFLNGFCLRSVLLTAGTKDFQAKKIEAIGVSEFFDEIIQIDGGKDNVLKPFASEDKYILFINDNLAENKMIKKRFPAVEVLTKFNPSYWTEEECKDSGIPCFKTLSEMRLYLENII